MKRLLFSLMLVTMGLPLAAQMEEAEQPADTKAKKVKKGWNFGALPTVTFDSDRGFQYGALANVFHYGDGSRYPKYNHSIYVEWSRYTKGSGINRFAYDSDKLIPGIRLTTDISYLTEQALDFWGFNGYDAVYNKAWETTNETAYKSRMFYKYDNRMLRMKADFQGKIGASKFNWIGGFAFYSFQVGTVNIDKLNEGKSEEDKLPYEQTLYDHYVDWNIIKQSEKDGSWVNYLKAGIVFDSRDDLASPNRGVWTEAVVRYAPTFLVNETHDHAKLSIIHRQYLPIKKDVLVFAYRLAYQQTLYGDVPFYAQPVLATAFLRAATNQGLGGASTLRGVKRNRVVGDGVFLGNVELRYRFWNFELLNQNIYVATNVFLDFGRVLDPIHVDLSNIDFGEEEKNDYFAPETEEMHNSVGAGLKLAMNHNFILSVDYGKALDQRDGNSGLYIRLNYLF